MFRLAAARSRRAGRSLARVAALLGAALTLLSLPVIARAQTSPAPLHAGCQAILTWDVGTDNPPETVDLLFIGLPGDTITIFATGTENDGVEEVNVPCLAAGAYEGRVTATAGGEVVFSGPLRTLVAAAPVLQLAVEGASGQACGGTVTFSGRALDDCSLAIGDVAVNVALLTPNATLGTPDISITASGDTILVSGSVEVSDVSDSAALVRVTLTATDGCALVAEATADAAVADTSAPVVTCPEDVTVDCTGGGGTPADDPQLEAFFAGFTAVDSCDTSLTIGNDAPDFFPLGETLVTFTATDGSGNSASCGATVTVIDTIPPTIRVDLNRTCLWPPNHKFDDIVAHVTVSDECDPEAGFELVSIESSEPGNGHGDGHTQPDVQGAATGTPDTTFALRAERSGNGEGRVYTITYRAFDGAGNEAFAAAYVRVPHDRGGRARASNGYSASGEAVQTADGRMAIVVPSWTDDLDGTAFDATTIRYYRTQIGNMKGVVDVADTYLGDLDGDGRRDAVFVFPGDAVTRLHLQAPGQQDKTSLHFEDTAANDWVVDDIFALGAPLTVDLSTLEHVEKAQSDAGDTGDGGGQGDPGTPVAPMRGMLLAQPNPFTPSTAIRFVVPKDGPVSLRVFDIAGRPVRVLADGFRTAGEYSVTWDGTRRNGSRLTPGVYLVRLELAGHVVTDKVIMLK